MAVVATLGCVAAGVQSVEMPASGDKSSGSGEVFSEIGDLWRERDAFYLRVDGRMPKEPGTAPVGAKEMVVRVEAMTRGRPWPGRWTMVEVEIQTAAPQSLEVGFGGGGGGVAPIDLHPGKWVPIRIPVGPKAQDLILRAATGLRSPLQFRRVRLVDDREVFWDQGWKVEKAAGMLRFSPARGEAIVVPAGELRVVESGAIRSLAVDSVGRGAAVYASGRVSSEVGSPLMSAGAMKLEIGVSDDVGRVDRTTQGDADGDGYNEARGAMILKVSGRRVRFTVKPQSGDSVTQPAIELRGLPAGTPTVLWEGAVVRTVERLNDGTLLIELPGAVRGEQRVDVTVTE